MREVLLDGVPSIIIISITLFILVLQGSLDEGLFFLPGLLTLSVLQASLVSLSYTLDYLALVLPDLRLPRVESRLHLRLLGLLEVHARQFLLQLVDNVIVAIEIDLVAQLWVLLDVLKEHLVVLFVALLSILALLFVLADWGLTILFDAILLGEVLKLPQSVLPTLLVLGIGLLNEDNGRDL